jgi:hypothetical protein
MKIRIAVTKVKGEVWLIVELDRDDHRDHGHDHKTIICYPTSGGKWGGLRSQGRSRGEKDAGEKLTNTRVKAKDATPITNIDS